MLKLYGSFVESIISKVFETQFKILPELAELILDRVARGNRVVIYGAGHGHELAEEMLDLVGGFNFIESYNPQDLFGPPLKAGYIERTEAFAEVFYSMMDLKKGDVLWLISNSGTNGVVVELAKRCKENGITLIAHTNMKQTSTVSARHSCGKKMVEFADYIIDNCGEDGDAAFETVNGKKQGPTSNGVGTFILQGLNVCFATVLHASNCTPEDVRNGNYARCKVIHKEAMLENLNTYYKDYMKVLKEVFATQLENIQQAAALSVQCVMAEGRNMMFGMVHDHTLVEEIHSRAGTIMCNRSLVSQNIDIQLYDGVKKATLYANISEYADALLRSVELNEKDVLFLISQSANENAMRRLVVLAKEKNCKLILHTNKKYADTCSEHPLYQNVDVVIDNCCPKNQLLMKVGKFDVGYVGTSIGCFINQCYVMEMTKQLFEHGIDIPARISINTDKGLIFTEELNKKYFNDTVV
ncbi:MAG: sugar isomerase domain-containing protein [Anaerorhabdus sp.]|uniref:sugar isomerase domain-containing protein n=1 Tax=Anaerorhabdus sp. TaxID=1872524 RepID=UPI002FC75B3F